MADTETQTVTQPDIEFALTIDERIYEFKQWEIAAIESWLQEAPEVCLIEIKK